MDIQTFERYEIIWNAALTLPNSQSLTVSAVEELSEYFSKNPKEIINILSESVRLLAEDWNKMNININNIDSVISFYNNTNLEIFELMDWHTNRYYKGPLNYVCAMDIAKKRGFKKYLDYGSGVGSGAIVFLSNGFYVTCADVAKPLIDYVKYRIKKRGLEAKFVDLRNEKLEKDAFEIITCFDVLEHSPSPGLILKELRKALKDNGLLFINNAELKKVKEQPMHISNPNLEKKIRCLGFDQLWSLQKEFKKCSKVYVIALEKVHRSFVINGLFYLYDNFCPIWLAKIIKKLLRN
jgi:2-polyprenyl-3-methyl-5-hydroxy-6-metoxy-1,4-benzoquinol methylase